MLFVCLYSLNYFELIFRNKYKINFGSSGHGNRKRMKLEFKWLTVLYAAVVTLAVTMVFVPCMIDKIKPGFWLLLFCFVFYFVIIVIALSTLARTRWFEVTSGSCLEWAIFWCAAMVVGILALPIVLARSPRKDPYIDWISALLSFLGHLLLITFSVFFISRIYYAKQNNIW